MASCHRRAMLSILHICYRGWEKHSIFDMLSTEAKFSKQHGNQNGEKNNKKKKDSCTCKGSAFVQLNKSVSCSFSGSSLTYFIYCLVSPSHVFYFVISVALKF